MRAEKQNLAKEYAARLNASPFFLVVDYTGLKVTPITELRKRLAKVGAEMHVVKNTVFRIAVKEAGITDLEGALGGQTAVVTGQKDISATAKVLKTFKSEFEKPKVRFGFLGNKRLEAEEVTVLADLPSLDILRSTLMGLLSMPATRLVQMINTPGTQLARVLKAKGDKEGAAAPEAQG